MKTTSTQKSRKGKEVARPKRKSSPILASGPTKKIMNKGKDQAQVSFNPEGFYEVKVSYEHVSKLATGCGFQQKDVQAIINKDNEERRILATDSTTRQDKDTEIEAEGDMGSFDPDPADELTSDEEV